jgi:transposase-like protein
MANWAGMNHRIERARPKEEIEKIVADYERSGLTQEEYARQHGLKVGTLRYWIYHRLRAVAPTGPALVEVQVPPTAALVNTHYRLDFPGGKSLSFSGPVRQEELEQLCQLLSH